MPNFKISRPPVYQKVALAAAVVFFFSASSAPAGIVAFLLVQPLSSLTQKVTLTGPVLGGTVASTPQAVGSDITTYFGHIYVDINPGSIQLMPGSSISAAVNGSWAPHDPVVSDPLGPPAVGTDNGNYGLHIAALQMTSNQHGLRLDNGAPGIGMPSTPMAMNGSGNFSLAGQAMQFTQGRQAFVSVLGNGTDDVIGFPTIFGMNGADIGHWDVGTQTLTIPVHSMVTFNVTHDFGGIDQTVYMTGQLVAVPYVPEPSTMTLLGFGVVGLLSCVWRARKRKNLIA